MLSAYIADDDSVYTAWSIISLYLRKVIPEPVSRREQITLHAFCI